MHELVVTPWGKPPLVRIHGNRGLRWQTRSLLDQLGFFAPCPTCRRCRRVFHGDLLVCAVSGHAPRHKKWTAQLGEPAFELTCQQTELPALAGLAVGLACGAAREDLLLLGPALKLLDPRDQQLSHGTSYLWTTAARKVAGLQPGTEEPGPTLPGRTPSNQACRTWTAGKGFTGQTQRPGLALWSRPKFVRMPSTPGARPHSFPGCSELGPVEGGPGRNDLAAIAPGESWSEGAESELKDAGYRTAVDFLTEFFGKPPSKGAVIQLGRQASELCLAFGVAPRHLRKPTHTATYWPVETLVPGSM